MHYQDSVQLWNISLNFHDVVACTKTWYVEKNLIQNIIYYIFKHFLYFRYDYDLDSGKHVREYYISNFLPLFAKCYSNDDIPRRAYDYLEVGIFELSLIRQAANGLVGMGESECPKVTICNRNMNRVQIWVESDFEVFVFRGAILCFSLYQELVYVN